MAKAKGVRDGITIERTMHSLRDPQTGKMTALIAGGGEKEVSSTILYLPSPSLVGSKTDLNGRKNNNLCHHQHKPTLLKVIRSQAGAAAVALTSEDVPDEFSFSSSSSYIDVDSSAECASGSSVISFYMMTSASVDDEKSSVNNDLEENSNWTLTKKHQLDGIVPPPLSSLTITPDETKHQQHLPHPHHHFEDKLLDVAPFLLVNRTKFNFSFSQSGCPVRCVVKPSSSTPSLTSSSSSSLLAHKRYLSQAPTLNLVAEDLPAGSVAPFSWYEPEVGTGSVIRSGVDSNNSSRIGVDSGGGGGRFLDLNYRFSDNDVTNGDATNGGAMNEGTHAEENEEKDVFLGRFDISSPGVTLLKEGSSVSSSFFRRLTHTVPNVDLVLQVLIVPREGQHDFVRIVCLQSASQPVGLPFASDTSLLTLSSSSLSSSLLSSSTSPPAVLQSSDKNIDSSLLSRSELSSSSSSHLLSSFSTNISEAEALIALLGRGGGRGSSSLSSTSLQNHVQSGKNAGNTYQSQQNSSPSLIVATAANPINAVLGRHARLHLRLSSVIINIVNSSQSGQATLTIKEKAEGSNRRAKIDNNQTLVDNPSSSESRIQGLLTSSSSLDYHLSSTTSILRQSSSHDIAALIPAHHVAGVHVMTLFISGIDLTATDEGFVIATATNNSSFDLKRQENRRSAMTTSAFILGSIFSPNFSTSENSIPAPMHPVSRSLTLSVAKISVYRPSSASPHVYKEVIFIKSNHKHILSNQDANNQEDAQNEDSLTSSDEISSSASFSSSYPAMSSNSDRDYHHHNNQKQLQHFFTLSLTQSPFCIKVPGGAAVVAVDPFSWRNLGFASTQVNIDIQPGGPQQPLCLCLTLDTELVESLLTFVSAAQRIVKTRTLHDHHLYHHYAVDIKDTSLLLHATRIKDEEVKVEEEEIDEERKKKETNSDDVTSSSLFRSQHRRQHQSTVSLVGGNPSSPSFSTSRATRGISVHHLRSSFIKRKTRGPLLSSPSSTLFSAATNIDIIAKTRRRGLKEGRRKLKQAPIFQSELELNASNLPPFISRLSVTQGFTVQVAWEGSSVSDSSKNVHDHRHRLFSPQYSEFLSMLRHIPSISSLEPLSIAIPTVSVEDTAVALPGKKSLIDVFVDALLPRLALQQFLSPWRLASLLRFAFTMWRGGGAGEVANHDEGVGGE